MKNKRRDYLRITAFLAALLCLVLVTIAKAAWLVEWDVVTTTSIPCPQPKPVADEYGREPDFTRQTLAACFATSVKTNQRVFEVLHDAEGFVKRGKESVANMWPPELQNFTITEVGAE